MRLWFGILLIKYFGENEINKNMAASAKRFVLWGKTSDNVESFNGLFFQCIRQKHLEYDIELFPLASVCTKHNIFRAYLQY